MIKYKQGDILSEDVEAIVNTVNCVGVMGRGLALQYKNKFPENYKIYAKACKAEEVMPGKMFVTQTGQLTNPKYIINFPTKRHWKGKSKIEDIEDGLVDLINVIKKYDIKSIAIPPLGSGLGGLDWSIVKSKIENTFSNIKDVNIIVYQPLEDKDRTNTNFKKVSDLVSGFETPFGLGLLSTVHWVMKHNNTTDTEQIVFSVYDWNKGKQQFSKKQIQIARDILIKEEWIIV